MKKIARETESIPKNDHADLEEIASFVREEMFGSGRLWGYHWSHLSNIQKGFVDAQETMSLVQDFGSRSGTPEKMVSLSSLYRYFFISLFL